MINGLTSDLIKAKNELTALKTAHVHGLGMTQFYFKDLTIDNITGPGYAAWGKLTVTIAPGEIFPPVFNLSQMITWPLQLGEGLLSGFNSVVFNSTARTITYTELAVGAPIASTGAVSETIRFMSSSKIESMSWDPQ